MNRGSPVRLRRLILLVLVAAGFILLLSTVFKVKNSPERNPGKTNEERVEFLRSLGWNVSDTPIREQIIRLPKEFPEVLKKYNDLQIDQGFDLMRYAGKEVSMYTYRVETGEEDPQKQAVLYVYKNRIIGGDIHSPAFDGEMEPVRKQSPQTQNG